MNAALKATIAPIAERTVKAVCGSVAVGGAAIVLFVVGVLHQSLGAAVSYGLTPFAIAVAAWGILTIIRLRLVGALPKDVRDRDVIPTGLRPWIPAGFSSASAYSVVDCCSSWSE